MLEHPFPSLELSSQQISSYLIDISQRQFPPPQQAIKPSNQYLSYHQKYIFKG